MLAKKLQTVFLITAITYLASLQFTPYSGQFIVKVFPIVVLLISSIYLLSDTRKIWIGSGILASGIGDILLALPIANSFIFGLTAFLIAQIIYAISFYKFRQPSQSKGVSKVMTVILIAYALAMGYFILPSTDDMLYPVAAYLTVITLMGISALTSSLNWKVSVGALFFIASDTALALSLFKSPHPFSSYIVMVTYYIAQLFIVFGMIDSQKRV